MNLSALGGRVVEFSEHPGGICMSSADQSPSDASAKHQLITDISQVLKDVDGADHRAVFLRATREFVSLLSDQLSIWSVQDARGLLRKRDPILMKDALSAALSCVPIKLSAKERSRQKGYARFKELIEAHGGTSNTVEVAKLLGTTADAVRKRAQAKSIIAFKIGEQWRYPIFQFKGHGLAEGVREVLEILKRMNGHSHATFLLTHEPDLGGITRLDALADPDLKPLVLRAASHIGIQGPL